MFVLDNNANEKGDKQYETILPKVNQTHVTQCDHIPLTHAGALIGHNALKMPALCPTRGSNANFAVRVGYEGCLDTNMMVLVTQKPPNVGLHSGGI